MSRTLLTTALVACILSLPGAFGADSDSALWIQGDDASITLGNEVDGVTIERDASGNLLFGDMHTPTKVKLSDIAAVIAMVGGGASSCKELYDLGIRISKVYTLSVQGQLGDFFCDMDRDGGGWTLVGSIEGSHVTKNMYNTFSDWGPTYAVACEGRCEIATKAPLSSGFLKTSWASFSDVREEIFSGSRIVYSFNLTSTQMNCVQSLYGMSRAQGCVRPSCRLGTPTGTEVLSCQNGCGTPGGCSSGTGPSSILGYQHDVYSETNCWFGRGNCCSGAGGTGACSLGDADGTRFGKVWLR